MLAALLDKSLPPNLRNDNGQTPITGAAFKGFRDVSKRCSITERMWKAHRPMAARH